MTVIKNSIHNQTSKVQTLVKLELDAVLAPSKSVIQMQIQFKFNFNRSEKRAEKLKTSTWRKINVEKSFSDSSVSIIKALCRK